MCARSAVSSPWERMFGPLRHGTVDELMVVGQIGQSIDGRIATQSGPFQIHQWPGRADAICIVCVRWWTPWWSVSAPRLTDDPQLTVRRVTGPNPARVVIDPRGRLPATARMFAADGIRRFVVTAAETRSATGRPASRSSGCRSSPTGGSPRRPFLRRWRNCGFRRVLIEGGADTVSRFLGAGCLDHLHVVVAPIILGSGPAGIASAADRARRSGSARADAHVPPRRRDAARLRSFGPPGRRCGAAQKIDVTDPDA